jgi:hypothetical protein
VQGARSPGNDLRLEHELALLDVAAGQCFLRETAGYRHSVLLGNSGGAALFAFYMQQAALEPEARIRTTPGGRPTNLAAAVMPQADGMALVSPHLGPGKLVLAGLDPSVIDESDALATDDALSPFSPGNGYVAPPAPTRYAPEFLARYRAAQLARVHRIDAMARVQIAARQDARRAAKAGAGFDQHVPPTRRFSTSGARMPIPGASTCRLIPPTVHRVRCGAAISSPATSAASALRAAAPRRAGCRPGPASPPTHPS